MVNTSVLQDPEIRTRTSWIDADTAKKQVKKGKIKGNMMSLRLRAMAQKKFYSLGVFLQRNNGKVLFIGLLLLSLCCVGLKNQVYDTDIQNLWFEESSRVHQESEYIKSHLGTNSGNTVEEIIQTDELSKGGVLHRRALLKHLKLLRKANSITVQLYNREWKLKDICAAIPLPRTSIENFDHVADSITPCIITTPLDCFFEASSILDDSSINGNNKWSMLDPYKKMKDFYGFEYRISKSKQKYLLDSMEDAGISHGYLNRPCINPESSECPHTAANKHVKTKDVDYAAILNGGCSSFAENYLYWPEGLILGGIVKNSSHHIINATALRSTIHLMNVNSLYNYHIHSMDIVEEWSRETALHVLNAWKYKFSQLQSKSYRIKGTSQMYIMASSSYDVILKAFSQFSHIRLFFGFLLMIVYATISLIRWKDAIHSMGGVAIGGVIVSALGIAGGMGLCSVSGLKFNPSSTQILPYFAFALSTGDLFIMISTFNNLHQSARTLNISSEEFIGQLLKRVGITICLTGLVIISSLLSASLVPIPALSTFTLQAVVLVVIGTGVNILLVPCIISIDLIRRKNDALDVFCCFKGSHSVYSSEEPHYDSPPPGYSDSMYLDHIPSYNGDTYTQRHNFQLNTDPVIRDKNISWSVKRFVCEIYAPSLQLCPVKVFAILLMVSGIALSCYGCSKLHLGGSFVDLVPKNTDKHDFLYVKDKYFSFYEFFAVTKDQFDYPNNQQLLHDYHIAMSSVKGVLSGPKVSPFWLDLFRNWLIRIQKELDKDRERGAIVKDENGLYPNCSYAGHMAYKLIIQTGDTIPLLDYRRVNISRLVDQDGIINPQAFYNYLSVWTSNEELAYTFSQGNIHPSPKDDQFLDDDSNMNVKRSFAIKYASSKYYIYAKQDQLLETIKEIREISAKFAELDLPNFPSGPLFVFNEEFLSLPFYFMLIGSTCSCLVFIVYYLCTFDFPASLFMVSFQIIIAVHVLGLLGLLNIPLSSTPMVVVVISIGVSSVYTLHVCTIFQNSVGCRNTRMRFALVDICTPTINNALGSLLCLSMLAGAEFGFIVRYFFVLMYSLILFGLVYTLLIIPVCLSIFGPTSMIRTRDGSEEIPQPSPEPSPLLQRRNQHSNRRPHHLISTATGIQTPPPPPASSSPHSSSSRSRSGSRHQQRQKRRHAVRFSRVPSDLSLTTITEESETSSITAGVHDIDVPPSILVRPTSVVLVQAQNGQQHRRHDPDHAHSPDHAPAPLHEPIERSEYQTTSRHHAGKSRHQPSTRTYTLDKCDTNQKPSSGYIATVQSTTKVTVKIRTSLPGEVISLRRDISDSDSSCSSL